MNEPERDSEEVMSRLLRLAGPRPPIPAEITRRVHATVRSRWRHGVRARRRVRIVAAVLAVAACVLLALGALWRSGAHPRPAAPSVVMALERAVGTGVRSMAAGSAPAGIAAGAGVVEGAWLETGPGGRAAFRLPSGASLRLDTGTRLRTTSVSSLWLEHGGVYVDAGGSGRLAGMDVVTAQGLVREVGTQFEVRADPGRTRVSVREGAVRLRRGGGEHAAEAGWALTADDSGRVLRTESLRFGPGWGWTEETAPEIRLEGRSLQAVVDGVARETGWSIRFADAATARSAAAIRLHGSAAGLLPSEALEAALATCGLRLRREGGVTAWIEPL